MDQADQDLLNRSMRTTTMICFAISMSVPIYVAIAWFMATQGPRADNVPVPVVLWTCCFGGCVAHRGRGGFSSYEGSSSHQTDPWGADRGLARRDHRFLRPARGHRGHRFGHHPARRRSELVSGSGDRVPRLDVAGLAQARRVGAPRIRPRHGPHRVRMNIRGSTLYDERVTFNGQRSTFNSSSMGARSVVP